MKKKRKYIVGCQLPNGYIFNLRYQAISAKDAMEQAAEHLDNIHLFSQESNDDEADQEAR